MIDRRSVVGAGSITLAAGALPAGAVAVRTAKASSTIPEFPRPAGPRARVLIVNDLAGDVDGLFATAHALLSPSTEVRGIIGAGAGDAALTKIETAFHATKRARELVRLMGLETCVPVFEGAARPLSTPREPARSPGVDAIVAEAMRTDTTLPLYVTAGSGLTEVASALAFEPRIAGRFTLVWIGGEAPPAGRSTRPGLANGGEYNFSIDRLAAQYVFNDTTVPMWQVPNSAYAPCMISIAELRARVATQGRLGRWLWDRLCDTQRILSDFGVSIGETYTLGDSPLVALSALTSWPPASMDPPRFDLTLSSRFEERPAPRLNLDGTYAERADGRRIRVYSSIDTRTMFEDMFLKIERAAIMPPKS